MNVKCKNCRCLERNKKRNPITGKIMWYCNKLKKDIINQNNKRNCNIKTEF